MKIMARSPGLLLFVLILGSACNSGQVNQSVSMSDSSGELQNEDTLSVVRPAAIIPADPNGKIQVPISLDQARKLVNAEGASCSFSPVGTNEELRQYVVPLAYSGPDGSSGFLQIRPGNRWLLHRAYDNATKLPCFVLEVNSVDSPVQYFRGDIAFPGVRGLSDKLAMEPCLRQYLGRRHLRLIERATADSLTGNQRPGQLYSLEVPPGSTPFFTMSKYPVAYCVFICRIDGSGSPANEYLLWALDRQGNCPDKFFYRMGGYSCVSSGADSCPL